MAFVSNVVEEETGCVCFVDFENVYKAAFRENSFKVPEFGVHSKDYLA